ncbi:MAG: hypothetical protein AB7E32_08865 [Desulfovibrio sp.]
MSEKWVQHIGDDQLVYGMPKHMSGGSGGVQPGYWHYLPKPTACEKCRTMEKFWFKERPGPVHPNCQCEVRQEPMPRVGIVNTLQGFEDNATEKFDAGQKITVTIQNLGPFVSGAKIWVDRTEWKSTNYMKPGKSETFTFTKLGELPVPWEVYIVIKVGDNSTLQYTIKG